MYTAFHVIFELCYISLLLGSESCFEHVTVQKRGEIGVPEEFQVIVPRANFICSGRITGITASMNRNTDGTIDPYLQVWHPVTSNMNVYNKVDEVQLVESEIVEEVDNDNNTYWLVNITLIDDDRVEFEAGDVIGYYHPPDTRYQMWSIQTTGYRVYGSRLDNSSNTINLDTQEASATNRQPLIQFIIGSVATMYIQYVIIHVCCRHPM